MGTSPAYKVGRYLDRSPDSVGGVEEDDYEAVELPRSDRRELPLPALGGIIQESGFHPKLLTVRRKHIPRLLGIRASSPLKATLIRVSA